jgi:histidine ammonia-lyase
VLPLVPEQGSVGASGDLAPLAHVALALIGEGTILENGRRRQAGTALRRAGLEPLRLAPKEGLALVNGTQFAGAIGCLALGRARALLQTADVAAALSTDVLRGTWRAFDERIHAARPHSGQRSAAANLLRLMRASPIWKSHERCPSVQDAYSLRCAPQVHGAARDAVEHAVRVMEIEINASTDNPMVFSEKGDIVSGGNFHGAPIAAVFDYACLALSSVASIAERRTERLVNPLVSGLPAFLAREPGLESGLMMAQVTAASLVSECKTLAHPGSVDSIPTSAMQEDHVSMAPWCARTLRGVTDRLETIVAIELLCGVVGLRYLRPLRTSGPLERVAALIERDAGVPDHEFPPGPVIEAVAALVRRGVLLDEIRSAGVRLR